MRSLLLLPLCCLCLHAQATLVIQPETITHCNSAGLGKARIVWDTPGPNLVQIRVNSASGTPMTGLEAPAGSAETGEWVRDGLRFFLVDEAGRELANATARVRCYLDNTALTDALAASDYFPLEVGNEWVYRVNNRAATAAYATRRVVRSETSGGKLWYVVATTLVSNQQASTVETRYRTDAAGRVYRMVSNGAEELWLDPTDHRDPSAVLTVEQSGVPYSSALGTFRDSLVYSTSRPLLMERGTLVRGIGLAASESTMLSGSSGGFFESFELVYASLADGKLVFSSHGAGLELIAESATLDVSGKVVTNCAVPCYFTACGLMPGADAPGTYKPCFQVRLRIDTPTAATSASAGLSLTDATGAAVFNQTAPIPLDRPEAILFQQIPLYTAPNQPLAPGTYTVRARLLSAGGAETGGASVNVQVR